MINQHLPTIPLLTPEPPQNPGGVPLEIWANLPFLVCGAFVVVILIGSIFIVRENRRVAARQAREDVANTPPPNW